MSKENLITPIPEPQQLGIVSLNGVKAEQCQRLSVYLGLKKPVIVEGINGFDEQQIQQDILSSDPNINPYEVAGYVAWAKAAEAIRQGKFSPQKNPKTIVYTNDLTRVVEGKVMNKPKNQDEAVGQLRRVSGNRVVDCIGTAIVTEDGSIDVFNVLAESQMHCIPEKVISDMAGNPTVMNVAGSLPVFTRTLSPSGIHVMKSRYPTEIFVGRSGERPQHYGWIQPGPRTDTKALVNILLGGGFPLGDHFERMLEHLSKRPKVI